MPPPTSPGFARREIILGVGIILGVAAGFAYARVRNIRQHNEDETVICVIRQLSAAADQYYLENGVSTVALDQLVGATNYLKAIETVAGETYPTHFVQGMTFTVSGVGGARTVTYAP